MYFRWEKETKANKDRTLTDIKNLSEHEEEENYYKSVEVSNFSSKNYSEYKSNNDRNKMLSVEKYLNKIISYSKHMTKNAKKSDTWKIQLTIANNINSSIDNEEKCVMHSRSDNIEIMINDEADKAIKNFSIHLKIKVCEFGFNYVHLFYYKCHKLNPTCGGSYIDSPDWIITKKQQ